jgi:hypothetical protein
MTHCGGPQGPSATRVLRVLPVAVAVILGAGCAGDPYLPGTDLFEITGADRFRYTVTASYIYPLNDPQAEHHRLVQLRRHVRAAGACPKGYQLTRDPPMAYGSLNERMTERIVRDVTYLGACGG